MDSKIGFEMSLIVGEAIRGRCASFVILTVSEIFGGQTNSSILVVWISRLVWTEKNSFPSFLNLPTSSSLMVHHSKLNIVVLARHCTD